MRNINRLNEEIARWAFEILFKENRDWTIAFTNPTAGPWKTIKARSLKTNKIGEVYRFALEDDRPDIIMYNDKLKCVLIIEAKDDIEKLINNKQAKKSADVVVNLAKLLEDKRDNYFWSGRENYKTVLGLLWGTTNVSSSPEVRAKLFDYYHGLINDDNVVYKDVIIGIETLYNLGSLSCNAFFKKYNASDHYADAIVSSLIK